MKIRDNERGGALLMVLLLVVVFTVLGVALLSMNISASKQFDNKEEQVIARHQAEMGILHFKEEVKNLVQRAININNGSVDSLREDIEGISKLSLGDYEVEMKENGIDYDTVEEKLIIEIVSTGKSKSTQKVIDASIIVQTPNNIGAGGSGKDNPPVGSDVQTVNGNYTILKDRKSVPEKNNLYIKGNLGAENGNHSTDLTVENDLYITGSINMNNHSCIIVKGNLTVLGDMPKNLNAHIYLVVYGNAYFGKAPDKINSGGIFVLGNVSGNNLGNLSQYKKPLPEKSDCANIDDKPQYNIDWSVEPIVNPNYK